MTPMMTTESDEPSTAPLTNDVEFRFQLSALMGMESVEATRHHHAVCMECGRIDAVETESRRMGNDTVKRHTCKRCGVHGSTLVQARMGGKPALISSGGDVETVDLSLDENAEYRGTGLPPEE